MSLRYQVNVLDRAGEEAEPQGMQMEMGHGEAEALRGLSQIWTLDASYGLTSWLTVSLVVPFISKQQDVPHDGGEQTRSVGGPADPLLLLKLSLLGHNTTRPGALSLGLIGGIKLPFGRWQVNDELGPLPPGLQPGTGAVDLVAGLFVAKGVFRKAMVFGSLVYRWTDVNPRGYRLGQGLTLTGDLQIAHLWPVTLIGGLRLSAAATDTSLGRELDHGTGEQLFGHLGVAYHPLDRLTVNLDALIPIYQGPVGEPLLQSVSVVGGVTLTL